MAERVKEWPQWKPAPRRTKYPWDEWLNGDMWVLEQGKDFTSAPERMRQVIGMTARYRGLRVKTSVNKAENLVAVQVVGKRPRS